MSPAFKCSLPDNQRQPALSGDPIGTDAASAANKAAVSNEKIDDFTLESSGCSSFFSQFIIILMFQFHKDGFAC